LTNHLPHCVAKPRKADSLINTVVFLDNRPPPSLAAATTAVANRPSECGLAESSPPSDSKPAAVGKRKADDLLSVESPYPHPDEDASVLSQKQWSNEDFPPNDSHFHGSHGDSEECKITRENEQGAGEPDGKSSNCSSKSSDDSVLDFGPAIGKVNRDDLLHFYHCDEVQHQSKLPFSRNGMDSADNMPHKDLPKQPSSSRDVAVRVFEKSLNMGLPKQRAAALAKQAMLEMEGYDLEEDILPDQDQRQELLQNNSHPGPVENSHDSGLLHDDQEHDAIDVEPPAPQFDHGGNNRPILRPLPNNLAATHSLIGQSMVREPDDPCYDGLKLHPVHISLLRIYDYCDYYALPRTFADNLLKIVGEELQSNKELDLLNIPTRETVIRNVAKKYGNNLEPETINV